MRIVIFSIGTQGDVRPFVALGRGLRERGHSVCIATGTTCEQLVVDNGLDFAPLTADFLEMMAADPRAMQKGTNPLALLPTVRRRLREMAADWAEQGKAAARGAELLIGNGMVALLASSLAELGGVRCLETQLQPVTPCPDIPPMMLKPGRKALPGALNLGLYELLRVLTWQMLGAAYGQLRRDLGLPRYPWYGPYYRTESKQRRRLLAYSPHLLAPSPHWPDNIKVVGNMLLDDGQRWTPPAALKQFLAAGSAPVYIGFGSMVGEDRAAFSAKIVEGIRQSGRRAIVATGWGGLDIAASEQVYVCDALPHDWLFPRVATAVHHGGAGTTAAAARAGIPSVVIPFFGDQPFWAWCLGRAGAAPPALNRKDFSADQLATAIITAADYPMRQAAAELGGRMQQEDGVAAAIAQIQDWGLLEAADRYVCSESESTAQHAAA